jgi:hypothetical protein
MEVRLAPALGGDLSTIWIGVLNDSGSTVLTLFYMDLAALGNYFAYCGWFPYVSVLNAAGQTEWLMNLLVEIRLVDSVTLEPWGKWVSESAVLRHAGPGVSRVSGSGIRQALFFGTAAGNHHLCKEE